MVMNHDYKIQLFQGKVILETSYSLLEVWVFFLLKILGSTFKQDREQL